MTILEDLKSGRLVVVQREAMADLCDAVMADVSEAKRRLDADIPKDAPVAAWDALVVPALNAARQALKEASDD